MTIRLTLIIVLIIVSCKNETDLIFSAVKENISLNIEGNLAIDELIKKSNDLKCDDFRIVANSLQNIDLNKSEFVLFAKCPNRIIHHDGIQMPIYECNGFRDHGINLCDDYMTNIEKLKEFYINPKKRTYYPSNPRRAIVKIIVDESQTLNSIIPLINNLKKMRNQLEDENISKLPFIFSIQTIQRDSILLKPPSGVNLND